MLLIFAILAAALLYAKVPPVQDRQLDSLVQAGDIGGAQGYLLAKMDGIRELAPEQRQYYYNAMAKLLYQGNQIESALSYA